MVDRSGSIGSTNWQEMVRYMKSRVEGTVFNGPQGHRVGIVGYSSSASLLCPLDYSKDNLLRCIDSIVYTGGGTYTDRGIDEAGLHLDEESSPDRIRSIEGVCLAWRSLMAPFLLRKVRDCRPPAATGHFPAARPQPPG